MLPLSSLLITPPDSTLQELASKEHWTQSIVLLIYCSDLLSIFLSVIL